MKVPRLNSFLRATNQEDCRKGVKRPQERKTVWGPLLEVKGLGFVADLEILEDRTLCIAWPKEATFRISQQTSYRKPRSKT